MSVELVQRIGEQVPKRHKHQDPAQGDERHPHAPTHEKQGACHQLDHRDSNPRGPERLAGKKALGIWLDEEAPSMLQWAQLKHLPDPGHEENQPKNGAREENRPRTIGRVWRVHHGLPMFEPSVLCVPDIPAELQRACAAATPPPASRTPSASAGFQVAVHLASPACLRTNRKDCTNC